MLGYSKALTGALFLAASCDAKPGHVDFVRKERRLQGKGMSKSGRPKRPKIKNKMPTPMPTPIPTASPQPSSSPSMGPPEDFLLCRQVPNRPDFGFQEAEPDYLTGEPVFSMLTNVEANAIVTDISTTVGTVLATGAGIAGAGAISASLTAGAGGLSVFTHFFGKSETDITQALIRSEFARTNQMIDMLAIEVSQGFEDVRMAVADNTLDELVAPLQAIDFAYKEMILAFNDTTNATAALKRTYTDRYRNACHAPHSTPDDIFRELYGFACGAAGINRPCAASDGRATGFCQFGIKKRQYVLDIFNALSGGDILRFNEFSQWLVNAMLLAQFHSAACLPLDPTSCTDGATDPIRLGVARDHNLAFQEVIANLQRTSDCFVEEFRANINEGFLIDIAGNGNCLNAGGSDPSINQCMATVTRDFIAERFTDWNWLVIVYNFESADNRDSFINGDRSLVDRDGETGNNFGFIAIDNIGGLSNRFFHIMYRRTELGRKTNFNSDSGENIIDFLRIRPQIIGCLGECSCAEANRIWTIQEEREGLDICCVIDPNNNRGAAAREHGFLAFTTNNGIPRAAPANSIGPFDVFFNGQFIVEDRCDDAFELVV